MGTDSSSRSDRFDAVDWQRTDGDVREVSWRNWGFLLGFGLIFAAYLADTVGPGLGPVELTPEPLDWLTAVALLSLTAFVAVPMARHRETTRHYWTRFRGNRAGVVGLAYVIVFFAVGLLGPLFVSQPTISVLEGYQPPVGTAVDARFVPTCVGEVSGELCHGTWKYPLGTTSVGKSVVPFVVFGARTSLQVALISALVFVPTGTIVGLVAASAGGRTDAVLMRFAEFLQTVPAILIYLIVFPWTVDYRLLTMVAVFGLASWGGLARLVRNETLQLRDEQFVKAAEIAGADPRRVIRRHLLPNISGPVLTNATLQVPMLILAEAAISFLRVPVATGTATFGDPSVFSWGQTIFLGIRTNGVYPAWWITAFPAVLLVATVLAFNVLGDALRDAFDPRESY